VRRLRQRRAAQTVAAVNLRRVARLAQKGLFRAFVDGIVRLHQAVHPVRVAVGVGERRVAADGGNAEQFQFRQRVQNHQRDGVVHADVAVEPDRQFVHCAPSP
jgi:hypothetical protein